MKQYDNTYFKEISLKEINKFISKNYKKLIGSAIFTKNNSFVSKIVSWAESMGDKYQIFIPSHTGSIIEYNYTLYLFDMKPPKATMQPLTDYLLNTKDEFELVIRDFNLDTKMFSANIAYHNGEFYPYLSALRSVLTKRNTKWVRHCSELHLRELQKQNLFLDVNPEITPKELYDLLIYQGGNCEN